MGMTSVMFQASEGLKEALDKYVGEHNAVRAEEIRKAIAAHIGYDLSAEPKVGRPTKYASPEARKEAQKARQRERRQAITALIEAARKGAKSADIKALADSLSDGKHFRED